MSLILKKYITLREEQKCLLKKTIHKAKHRNQYSQPVAPVVSKEQLSLIQKQFTTQVSIPRSVSHQPFYRFHSNIQIPLELDSVNKLGDLTIDPFTFNYKVIRTEQANNLLTFTFQPYEREFTPFEPVYEFLLKKNEELAYNFRQCHFRFNKIIQTTQQEIEEFQSRIRLPFDCYVNRYTKHDNLSSTVQRVMNSQYLQLLGVNEEMLQDYLKETTFLPAMVYFNPNDDQQTMLNSCLKAASSKLTKILCKQELINYNGERQEADVQYQIFLTYDATEDCYFEFFYLVYNVDDYWTNERRVRKNNMNYFNIKQPFKEQEQKALYCDQTQIQALRSCGYKEI